MNSSFGAYPEEWKSCIGAGLTPMLLPAVQNPNISVSSSSRLRSFGKTPSRINNKGEATGFHGWTSHVSTADEIARWSKCRDYGICVRTGVGVIAFDCDCDDEELARGIHELFTKHIAKDAPLRTRGGAPRWLAPVRYEGEYAKTRILMRDGNMLEVLGTGQQFVAAGTHPKGSRYAWTDDIGKMPTASAEQVEAFLTEVQEKYGVGDDAKLSTSGRKKGKTELTHDRLADWLRDNGYVKQEKAPGELDIVCPWEDEHTGGFSGDGSSTYYQAGTRGYSEPAFKCLHGHCAHRNISDLVKWAVSMGFRRTSADEFPEVPLTKEEEPLSRFMAVGGQYIDQKSFKIESSLPPLVAALENGISGYEVRFDTFRGECVVKKENGDWTELQDSLTVRMRHKLETLNGSPFKPIAKELMRDALELVADDHRFDYMCEYLEKQVPQWDGVDRVTDFFTTYCGAESTQYTQAVAKYIFSAMWGRATSPAGIKADIVPVLVGPQGAKKSTLVQVLAIEQRFSSEISFASKDDDIARKMRGKITIEIPELSGMGRREVEDLKRFISLEYDEHVRKYKEYTTRTPRRCTFWMTTNESEFLTDRTGNRRYAPVRVTSIDIDAVKRDLLQLWAQGRDLFKRFGIEHREVERLSEVENLSYMRSDAWADPIREWIDSKPFDMAVEKPILLTPSNLLTLALGTPAGRISPADSRRLAAVMRELGYVQKRQRVDGVVQRFYVPEAEKDDIPF